MTTKRVARFARLAGSGSGFTLIELIIVAVVISIIAAIAIPIFIRQRIAANEGSAVSTMRTISTAQSVFRESDLRDDNLDGESDYGTLEELSGSLGPSSQAPFIDEVLGSGAKSGYTFSITVFPGTDGNPEPRYSAFAFPVDYNRTGIRNFYVDQENIVRFNQGASGQGTIGPDSPPVGG